MSRIAVLLRRLALVLGGVLLLAAVGCGIGFAWFVQRAGQPAQAPPHVDAIVAFTGGPDRVETALRLLADRRADRLLLSGIGGGAELAELAHRAGVDPLPLAARVTIDRSATTTHANAAETAAWARANGVRSLLVVTASYHMPRAITELARALPEATLYPLPVVPAERRDRTVAPLRLMAEEYIKFLATTTGISAMLPGREASQSHGGHAG
ncbi:MAG: YdcF family protein [Acetobacteraceae bacterium]